MQSRGRGKDSDLWRGLIPLHVLHHAAEGDIYGLALIEELRGHGYAIGPGTLYPLLHRLTARGYLRERTGHGRRQRRYYATDKGRQVLAQAQHYVAELYAEMHGPRTRP